MGTFVRNWRNINYLHNFKCNLKLLSTQSQTQPDELIEYETIHLYTTIKKKKPHREPFMKNIFLGKCDTEMLGFPEVLNNEELKELNERVDLIKELARNKGEAQTLRALSVGSKLNMCGLQSSKLVGGLELNDTENCRLLEAFAEHGNRSVVPSIMMHQFCVGFLAAHATKHVRHKYLAALSQAQQIAAFCFLEEGVHDPSLMKTHAKLSDDGKYWLLSGNKTCVVNGGDADLLIVAATTDDGLQDQVQFHYELLSVFAVERAFGGIHTIGVRQLPVGFPMTDVADVSFDNTPVPIENVFGSDLVASEAEKGTASTNISQISTALNGVRLNTGPACIALLRKLLQQFANYTLRTQCGEYHLSHTKFIQEAIAQVNLNLYAIESLTYMTAGLIDRYEEQDCNLETSIVKIFSSEKCLESIERFSTLLGSTANSNVTEQWFHSLREHALGYVLLNETNEFLRIVIALLGIQHAGVDMTEQIKKLRNPFFFPGFAVKNLYKQRRQAYDNPKLNLNLPHFLHPSLHLSATWLEYCVLRMQYATEIMLSRYGNRVVEEHMELKKLADCAIDIYAMVSVLSRASRSYCIGLRNANHEVMLATAFCLDARQRISHRVLDIVQGPYTTNDITFQKLAKQAFKYQGYFAEHPLNKNF